MTPHQRLFSNGLRDVIFIRTKQNSQATTEQLVEVILELIYKSFFMNCAGSSLYVLSFRNFSKNVSALSPSSCSIFPPLILSLTLSSHGIIMIYFLPITSYQIRSSLRAGIKAPSTQHIWCLAKGPDLLKEGIIIMPHIYMALQTYKALSYVA